MASKLVTYSMDEFTLKRLDSLTNWLREPNKSNLLRILIDREYRRQLEIREEEEEECT